MRVRNRECADRRRSTKEYAPFLAGHVIVDVLNLRLKYFVLAATGEVIARVQRCLPVGSHVCRCNGRMWALLGSHEVLDEGAAREPILSSLKRTHAGSAHTARSNATARTTFKYIVALETFLLNVCCGFSGVTGGWVAPFLNIA